MKLSTLALAAIATLGFSAFSTSAFAQRTNNASANASARIVAGISAVKSSDLNFGQVVRSATAGTVVLDAATAARSYTGGTSAGLNGGNTFATFAVTGEPAYTYAVTLPTTVTITHSTTNTATMTVTGMTTNLTSNAGTLATDGTQSFNVGGTLNVGANQLTGTYTGAFSVTVTYQ